MNHTGKKAGAGDAEDEEIVDAGAVKRVKVHSALGPGGWRVRERGTSLAGGSSCCLTVSQGDTTQQSRAAGWGSGMPLSQKLCLHALNSPSGPFPTQRRVQCRSFTKQMPKPWHRLWRWRHVKGHERNWAG